MIGNRPIHILHIFGRMNRGGAEMRTVELLRHINHDQFHFSFCVLSGEPGSLDDEIRAMGGEVYPCRLGWAFPKHFRDLLQHTKADVVHSHVHYFSGFILRQAYCAGIQTRIAHFRNMYDDHSQNLRRQIQRKIMRRWINQYSTHILAVSEGAMVNAWDESWKHDPRCQVIYNGLDTSIFVLPPDRESVLREFCLPDNSHLYIHVGRMDAPKNHQRLVSIFKEIAQTPTAYLFLVGRAGNLIENQVREQIRELGIAERVIITGERTDVPRLLKAADAMIFPSVFEGLPGAVLESCAAGTPVLATNLPGIKEIANIFPLLVHPLSLNADDVVWANQAQEMAITKHDRDAAREQFRHSPFDLESSMQTFSKVWRESVFLSCQT